MRCHYFFDINLEQNKKLHFLPFGIFIDNLKFNLQFGSCKQNGSFVKCHAANHRLCYRMQTVLISLNKNAKLFFTMNSFSV